MSQHRHQPCALCGQPTRRSVRQPDGTTKFICGRPHEPQPGPGQVAAVVEQASRPAEARFARVRFTQPVNDGINLLSTRPRAGIAPAPVVPTPAEHVLLAQVVAVRQASRPRKRDVIARAWDALGAWLEQPSLPLPSVRRASRYRRSVVRRLAPYAAVVAAALPLVAVEAGWRPL
jgi:hypothetical protein